MLPCAISIRLYLNCKLLFHNDTQNSRRRLRPWLWSSKVCNQQYIYHKIYPSKGNLPRSSLCYCFFFLFYVIQGYRLTAPFKFLTFYQRPLVSTFNFSNIIPLRSITQTKYTSFPRSWCNISFHIQHLRHKNCHLQFLQLHMRGL